MPSSLSWATSSRTWAVSAGPSAAVGSSMIRIRASGGGTASALWRQILADVLDAEIATVGTTEGAAYGAGVLAAVGAGWFTEVAAATGAWVVATPSALPGVDVAAYAEAHSAYRELYPALAPTFHRG